jgi:allantoate deiminase
MPENKNEPTASPGTGAEEVMERCDALGGISEEPHRLTRRYGTPAMREVNSLVAGYMRAAGLATRRDNIGNIIGRYAGSCADGPTLLLGSHLDSVRDAGRYDGPLGVLVAIAAVSRLHARGEQLPFAIEVYGFADEEGLRFHHAYLGSEALAGALAEVASLMEAQQRVDDAGLSCAQAIRDFGGDPDALDRDRWSGGSLLGYCEVHIEQGPVLEAQGLPVGVVTAIQGQTRTDCTFIGQAGHAGTVPMHLRRDALCAASEFTLKIEALARETPGLVATVGQMEVDPGASNVIPGRVRLSVDIRHADDAVREAAQARLLDLTTNDRAVNVVTHQLQDSSSVHCDPRLAGLFARAIGDSGYPSFELTSGAGHDAVPLSAIAPVAMLFVRCKGGISHHPDEAVSTEDIGVAVDVLERFLHLLAAESGGAA